MYARPFRALTNFNMRMLLACKRPRKQCVLVVIFVLVGYSWSNLQRVEIILRPVIGIKDFTYKTTETVIEIKHK